MFSQILVSKNMGCQNTVFLALSVRGPSHRFSSIEDRNRCQTAQIETAGLGSCRWSLTIEWELPFTIRDQLSNGFG